MAEIRQLEARIARLESLYAGRTPAEAPAPLPWAYFGAALALGGVGAALGFLGLGLPNHPYQWALGAIGTGVAYHRRWLRPPPNPAGWIVAPLNAFQAAILFKLFIGSGKRFPFAGLQLPELSSAGEESSWWRVLPTLRWHDAPLTHWEIDLTLVQSFLLVVTVVGSLLRLQALTSLMAILLLAASVPAFASFQWQWVFPAIAATGACFYLQAEPR